MLVDQGHDLVSVLDGGLQAWTAAGHGLSSSEHLSTPTGPFPTRPWRATASRRTVRERSDSAVLIDARSLERYSGEEEPVDPKAGHIPGAISLPQADNLADDRVFLPPDALRSRFSDAGITESHDVIVHCGSGVTACHSILAMEVAGMQRPLLYVGSWSDWSSQHLPVSTGDAP
jgi:thiosulfate/3-mercaptopyruvate sulfurtransferase